MQIKPEKLINAIRRMARELYEQQRAERLTFGNVNHLNVDHYFSKNPVLLNCKSLDLIKQTA
jgi:hypothetical protein